MQRGGGRARRDEPRTFPATCFRLASSWSMIPAEVVCRSRIVSSRHGHTERKGGVTHEDEVAEGTSGEEHADPRLDLGELDVEPGGHNTALVDAAVELDDDLAGTVVVLHTKHRSALPFSRPAQKSPYDLLELVDVTLRNAA